MCSLLLRSYEVSFGGSAPGCVRSLLPFTSTSLPPGPSVWSLVELDAGAFVAQTSMRRWRLSQSVHIASPTWGSAKCFDVYNSFSHAKVYMLRVGCHPPVTSGGLRLITEMSDASQWDATHLRAPATGATRWKMRRNQSIDVHGPKLRAFEKVHGRVKCCSLSLNSPWHLTRFYIYQYVFIVDLMII